MDFLRKLFPRAFAATEKDKMVNALIVYIVIAVVGALVGIVTGALLQFIPLGNILGPILQLLGSVVDVYATGGVVLTLLVYFKVIKE